MDRRTSHPGAVSSNTGAHRVGSSLADAGGFTSGAVKMESSISLEQRKARKREQDRLCQRRKREKDRENLRRLEARLNGLQNADDSKTMLDLLLRHEQDQAKIDRQVYRLRQLQTVLQAGLQDLAKDGAKSSDSREDELESPEVEDSSANASVRTSSLSHATKATGAEPPISSAAQAPIIEYNAMPNATTIYSTLQAFSEYAGTDSLPEPTVMTAPVTYPQPNTASQPSPVHGPWVMAGNMVHDACKRVQHMQSIAVATPESIDQHIIVTVCLHGWDHAVPFMEMNHALWSCLRQVDEVILASWSAVARMSSLWAMWRTMKANAQGPDAVSNLTPKFLRPRPSQIHVPHRSDIDYFVWPGVRERLVFNPDKYYATETFLQVFSASTCFLWPFDLGDTFCEDKSTRLLQFSPELTRRLHNLNYWSIDDAFLAEYPEFVGDIPTYNSIPPRVDDRDAGGQYFYFQEEEQNQSQPITHPFTWTYSAVPMPAATKGAAFQTRGDVAAHFEQQICRGGRLPGGPPPQ